MILGEKIRTHRKRNNLSQEELAEKVATSRQTISSWENNKTYPDIQTIIVLSDLFDVSIESLIKEDVKVMKDILDDEERKKRIKRNKDRDVMNRLAAIRFFLAAAGGLALYPVYNFFPGYWFLFPLSFLVGALLYTIPIERYRKKYNLREYKDLVTFFDEKYDYWSFYNLKIDPLNSTSLFLFKI